MNTRSGTNRKKGSSTCSFGFFSRPEHLYVKYQELHDSDLDLYIFVCKTDTVVLHSAQHGEVPICLRKTAFIFLTLILNIHCSVFKALLKLNLQLAFFISEI